MFYNKYVFRYIFQLMPYMFLTEFTAYANGNWIYKKTDDLKIDGNNPEFRLRLGSLKENEFIDLELQVAACLVYSGFPYRTLMLLISPSIAPSCPSQMPCPNEEVDYFFMRNGYNPVSTKRFARHVRHRSLPLMRPETKERALRKSAFARSRFKYWANGTKVKFNERPETPEEARARTIDDPAKRRRRRESSLKQLEHIVTAETPILTGQLLPDGGIRERLNSCFTIKPLLQMRADVMTQCKVTDVTMNLKTPFEYMLENVSYDIMNLSICIETEETFSESLLISVQTEGLTKSRIGLTKFDFFPNDPNSPLMSQQGIIGGFELYPAERRAVTPLELLIAVDIVDKDNLRWMRPYLVKFINGMLPHLRVNVLGYAGEKFVSMFNGSKRVNSALKKQIIQFIDHLEAPATPANDMITPLESELKKLFYAKQLFFITDRKNQFSDPNMGFYSAFDFMCSRLKCRPFFMCVGFRSKATSIAFSALSNMYNVTRDFPPSKIVQIFNILSTHVNALNSVEYNLDWHGAGMDTLDRKVFPIFSDDRMVWPCIARREKPKNSNNIGIQCSLMYYNEKNDLAKLKVDVYEANLPFFYVALSGMLCMKMDLNSQSYMVYFNRKDADAFVVRNADKFPLIKTPESVMDRTIIRKTPGVAAVVEHLDDVVIKKKEFKRSMSPRGRRGSAAAPRVSSPAPSDSSARNGALLGVGNFPGPFKTTSGVSEYHRSFRRKPCTKSPMSLTKESTLEPSRIKDTASKAAEHFDGPPSGTVMRSVPTPGNGEAFRTSSATVSGTASKDQTQSSRRTSSKKMSPEACKIREFILNMHRNVNHPGEVAFDESDMFTFCSEEEVLGRLMEIGVRELKAMSPKGFSALSADPVMHVFLGETVRSLIRNNLSDVTNLEAEDYRKVNLIKLKSHLEKLLRQRPIENYVPPSEFDPAQFPLHYTEAQYQIRGGRASQEDVLMSDNFVSLSYGDFVPPPVSIYAVFDGHYGESAALYSSIHLPALFISEYQRTGDIRGALNHAFVETDRLYALYAAQREFKAGTTAVVCVISGDVIYVANAGDSEAILASNEAVLKLTTVHSPSDESEKARVIESGGKVMWASTWRVDGTLAVSRSIGDVKFPTVIPTPYITEHRIVPGDEFVVLASDGLFSSLSAVEVAAFVRAELKQGRPLDHTVKELVYEAVNKGSLDNISATIIALNQM